MIGKKIHFSFNLINCFTTVTDDNLGYVGFYYYNNESVGSRSADRQRWAGWIAAGAKRMFWRPNTLHAGDGMPYMYATAIARDFSWLGSHGLAATDFGVCVFVCFFLAFLLGS